MDTAKQRLEYEPGLAERWHQSLKGIAGRAREMASGFAQSIGSKPSVPYLPKSFPDKSPSQIAAACAVASAIRHLEKREAGFAITDIYKVALDTGLPTTVDEVEQAVARQIDNKNLVMGNDRASAMMTTENAIETERRIIAGVALGKGVGSILNGDFAAKRLQSLASEKSGIKLNPAARLLEQEGRQVSARSARARLGSPVLQYH